MSHAAYTAPLALAAEDVDLLAWFMQYQRPEDPDLERMIHVVLDRLAT